GCLYRFHLPPAVCPCLPSFTASCPCRLPPVFSDSVQPDAELVVEGVYLGLATGEEARLAQEHGQSALREREAVSRALEDGRQLRVDALLYAVAYGALHGGRETGGAPRVRYLDGA